MNRTLTRLKPFFAALTVFVTTLLPFSAAVPTALATSSNVTICHSTGTDTYEQISVNTNSIGTHNSGSHQGGKDIIPSGWWDLDGRNWDAEGQAIYNNGCVVPLPSCGTVTYEKSADFSDAIVSINFESSDYQIDVAGVNGWVVAKVWLDVRDDPYSGYHLYATGPLSNFNPEPGRDIRSAKVELSKACPSPSPSPSPSVEPSPSPSVEPSPSPSVEPSPSPSVEPSPSPSVEPSPSPSVEPSPSPSVEPSPSPTPAPDTDLCSNLEGMQTEVPAGYEGNNDYICTPIPGPTPVCPDGTEKVKIETVSVPANSSTGATSSSLASGSTYVFEAYGTWLNRGGTDTVDPEYTSYDSYATDGIDGDPAWIGFGADAYWNLLDLQVDNGFVNWGTYTSAHRYGMLYSGAGAPASFRIFDGDPDTNTLNEGWYGDNSGSLSVDIFQCQGATQQQATVSGLKFNDADADGIYGEESTLAEWPIWIGRKVQTLTIPAFSESGTPVEIPSTMLESGKTYMIRATGTYFANDGITADAKYSKRDPNTYWTDLVQNYESYGPELLDLQLDDASVDWGVYGGSHVYWYSYAGANASVNFRLNDIYPQNNEGSLTVDIFEVLDQTLTDGSGNFSMNVPDVDATLYVGEGTRPNWTQTAPMDGAGGVFMVSSSGASGLEFGNYYITPPCESECCGDECAEPTPTPSPSPEPSPIENRTSGTDSGGSPPEATPTPSPTPEVSVTPTPAPQDGVGGGTPDDAIPTPPPATGGGQGGQSSGGGSQGGPTNLALGGPTDDGNAPSPTPEGSSENQQNNDNQLAASGPLLGIGLCGTAGNIAWWVTFLAVAALLLWFGRRKGWFIWATLLYVIIWTLWAMTACDFALWWAPLVLGLVLWLISMLSVAPSQE